MAAECHSPPFGVLMVGESERQVSGTRMLREGYLFFFFFLLGFKNVFQHSIAQELPLIPTDSPSSEIIST